VVKNAHPETHLPDHPIDRILEPLRKFLHVEAASGVLLMGCTLIALVAANSPLSDVYLDFWKTPIGFTVGDFVFRHSLKHWINDGLMVLFFFVIGLEMKREIVQGELRDWRRAALPMAAALGGMIVPATLYLAIQLGKPGIRGWGIPMATDIAFVVGCIALLGPRVPHSLRILLVSLAIVDDIGAIVVIAVGYTGQLNWGWLAGAAVGLGFVRLLAQVGVRGFAVYLAVGVLVWFAFHESGVHATIAGVILGLMTPTTALVSEGTFSELLRRTRQVFESGGWRGVSRRGEKIRRFQHLTRETISPLEYLENRLHPWSGFAIMPLFALANAGVPLRVAALNDPIALAVVVGLVVGKPFGIVTFSWLAVKAGWARLPDGLSWKVLLAAGTLAGIGFTMSLFIAGLAFEAHMLDRAKIGVLAGSALSAVVGVGLLLYTLPKPPR